MKTAPQLPGQLHVRIWRGDAWHLDVSIPSLDLTDYDITATIHVSGSQQSEDIDDIVLAIPETDLANGEFSIDLTAAQSATLAADHHSWCCVLTPPFTEPELPRPRTFMAGRFIVEDCHVD